MNLMPPTDLPTLPVPVELDDLLSDFQSRFQFSGAHLGLTRIQSLLTKLGNPEQRVPFIHVAGTNGKGSVCAYLTSVLTTAGYKVGTYTSPHLVSWCERIAINGEPIAPNSLRDLLQQTIAVITTTAISGQKSLANATTDAVLPRPTDIAIDMPTQFEVLTAAAWLYFAQQQVDVAVMEVGLGGRLDATNVCDRPLVSVITSISLDHTHILGNTFAEIAAEKAGILKPNRPAVIGPLPPEAETVVKTRVEQLKCPAIFVQANARVPYPLALQGEIQQTNGAIAIAALQILQQQGWAIPEPAIQTGIAQARWPGRLQWIQWGDRPLLIDGAHNPGSACVLRQYVDSLAPVQAGHGIIWVMGLMKNKAHAAILQALLKPGDSLYLVPVPDPSSASPTMLSNLVRELYSDLVSIQIDEDVFVALEQARNVSDDKIMVLCGSLYLLGHFWVGISTTL